VLLASDYPFLDIFWTTLIIFLFFAWLMLLFRVFADIFRRHDTSGLTKTLWCIFVIVVPFLGVFIYLLANGHHMAERDIANAQAAQQEFDDRIRTVAADKSNPAAQIEQAKALLDSGAITQTEFDALKAKALS
jgi:Short C-terminal domain/Phospholipase_D-nuclease N-terminal